MTPEQEFTLTHLGIERWIPRTWSLHAPRALLPALWIVHDAPAPAGKQLILLNNILNALPLDANQLRVLSQAEYQEGTASGLPGPRILWSLEHLLTHPADKKQVLLDLLQVKQGLLACGQLV